jgi:hypothetical protein
MGLVVKLFYEMVYIKVGYLFLIYWILTADWRP